ncbi:hypothetical protein LMG19089_02930 [Ralstonia edaphis]|uniref:hypothetical protein n=1 Tax=Ralstonia edaphi TaxID=3058599 RepID=UPI0028F5C05D|nr:hypothetical protein [Ralstonia sp. LMG 6871]CAJ0701803.1 hypothetical protein LMG19089_02930 [Ralstonia sp. LMG 6871]
MSEHKFPLRYTNGEIRDADGRQLMVLMPSGCTKKFRDHAGKTLVDALNAAERDKQFQAWSAQAKPEHGEG